MPQLDFPSAADISVGDTYTGALTTWTWDGSKWTAFGKIGLDDLTDVALADDTAEDILVYNGSSYQNQPDVDGGRF